MVIVRHALKNSLIAAVTVVGLQTARLLGGSTIVETVFSWPGIGRLLDRRRLFPRLSDRPG